MEVTVGEEEGGSLPTQDQTLSSTDLSLQMKEEETTSGPETGTDSKVLDMSAAPTAQPSASPVPLQVESSTLEPKDLQEGQEIYIQTDGLAVQMAEHGMDRIVIVNGPDGTTMHIQTPEDVPLEAVHALLGIEASNEGKASQ